MAKKTKRKMRKRPARKAATKRSRKQLVARRSKNRTTDLVTGRQVRPTKADEDLHLFDSFMKIFEPAAPPRKPRKK